MFSPVACVILNRPHTPQRSIGFLFVVDLMQTSKTSPVYFVLSAVLLWSTGGVLIKLTEFDSFAVNLGRSAFAAIVVAAFTYRKGLKLDLFTFFTSFLYAGTLSAFVYATKNTTAANAIFLQYTAPVYIMLLSPFILGDKFRFQDLGTVAACLVGMSLFFVQAPAADARFALNPFAGNVAGLISGVFFGLYFIFLRHPRSLKGNPAVSVFYGNILVVLMMAPFVIQNPPATISLIDGAAIVFLGVFQIGFAYLLFTYGVAGGVRSLDASIIGFLEPLFNPVWVFVFLGERPSGWALLGGAVIIAAVAIHSYRASPARPA